MPNIEMIAQYMKNHPDAKVEIKGYASPEGSKELNQKLSEARANAVKNILVKTYKISANVFRLRVWVLLTSSSSRLSSTVLLHSMITMQLNKEISSSDIWSCDQVLLNFGLGGFFLLAFLTCLATSLYTFRQVILIR